MGARVVELGGDRRPLAPGTRVEVRRRFDERWTRGFEVAEAHPAGYLLRRLSDGALLQSPFARDELRRERDASWWW